MSSKSWSSLNRKKGLRKVSKKQSERLVKYTKAKKLYLKDHPFCEMCSAQAEQIHHKRGRGIYLADPLYFSALCAPCHEKIHRNPNWARDNGWLIR